MCTTVKTCWEDGQPLNRSSSQPQRTAHGHCFAQADILALHQQQPPRHLSKRGSHECNTRFRVSPFSTPLESDRARCYASTVFGRGVFIRELHPLPPGEQLALWAKLKFGEIFVPVQSRALSEINFLSSEKFVLYGISLYQLSTYSCYTFIKSSYIKNDRVVNGSRCCV